MSNVSTKPTNKLEAALAWSARGLPVFPLQEGGKLPLAGSNGHLDATLDPERIREMFTDALTGGFLNHNIGCSPRDGRHLIIDLDVKEDRQGISNYTTLGGTIAGLVVRTATGGLHIYCTCTEPLRTGAGKIAPGIDTRGADGYVVAPGSTIDGVSYEVIEDSGLLLPVPAFVAERIGTRADRDRSKIAYRHVEDDLPHNVARAVHIAQTHPPAVTGCWHDLGFKLGAELARVAMSPDAAVEIAEQHWVPRGSGFSSRDRFISDILGGYHTAVKDREHGIHSADAAAEAFRGVEIIPPPDEREAAAGASSRPPAPAGPAWHFLDLTTLQGVPVPEREFIVDQWLSPGHVTILYGEGGTGKSLLAQQLMTAVATGRPWLELPVTQCRAIGLFCEDPEHELHRRQAEINAALGVDFSDLSGMTWTSGHGTDNTLLAFDRDGQPLATPGFARLLSDARRFRARLVVVDTAADTFGGNENDRRQVRQFVGAALGRLALELNAAVLLCAHPSRAGRSTGDLDGGSTAWSNTARARWALARPDGQRGAVDPYERVLSRRKSNYSAIGEEVRMRWARGAMVPVGPPTIEETRARWAHAEITFLRLLNRYNLQGRNVSPHSRAGTYAPKVLSEQPDTEGLLRSDFEGALDRMLNDGRLRVDTWGPPSARKQRLVPAYNRNGAADFR